MPHSLSAISSSTAAAGTMFSYIRLTVRSYHVVKSIFPPDMLTARIFVFENYEIVEAWAYGSCHFEFD